MGMMIRNDSEDADICVLPEWFTPSDRDVICGWARQYQGHGEPCGGIWEPYIE
jgi:hypothetical protein